MPLNKGYALGRLGGLWFIESTTRRPCSAIKNFDVPRTVQKHNFGTA
jgi:hypothetical protein